MGAEAAAGAAAACGAIERVIAGVEVEAGFGAKRDVDGAVVGGASEGLAKRLGVAVPDAGVSAGFGAPPAPPKLKPPVLGASEDLSAVTFAV